MASVFYPPVNVFFFLCCGFACTLSFPMQSLALAIFTRNPPMDPEPLERYYLECLDEGRAYQACTASGQVSDNADGGIYLAPLWEERKDRSGFSTPARGSGVAMASTFSRHSRPLAQATTLFCLPSYVFVWGLTFAIRTAMALFIYAPCGNPRKSEVGVGSNSPEWT